MSSYLVEIFPRAQFRPLSGIVKGCLGYRGKTSQTRKPESSVTLKIPLKPWCLSLEKRSNSSRYIK